MKKIHLLFSAVLLILILSSFSSAQEQRGKLFQIVSIKPGLGFECFSRTISWDEDEYTSKLKSYFFTFTTEFEIREGLSLGATFGYSFSNYDALIFRELPISLDLDVGSIKGYILGGEIKSGIIHSEDLKIEVLGQFFYYLGTKDKWEIPLPVVKGKAEGKPTWMRVSAGPIFTYTGFNSFHPYLSLSYNKLWGKFKMDQILPDLTRREEKKISAESSFCTSLGFILKLTEALSFRAEGNFMPYKDGVDLGFMIRAMYSF